MKSPNLKYEKSRSTSAKPRYTNKKPRSNLERDIQTEILREREREGDFKGFHNKGC